MKLLLDAMYPARLAEELRRRGHDVRAVLERDDLREEDDETVFRIAAEERRALMTENVRHLRPIVDRYFAERIEHCGLLCVSPKSLPRMQRAFGRLLRSIDAYLAEHQAADALFNRVEWLPAAPGSASSSP